MAAFDMNSEVRSIPPRDLTMLTQTLQVWCNQNNISRDKAMPQAKVLLETYKSGKRSQIELLDALVTFKQ